MFPMRLLLSGVVLGGLAGCGELPKDDYPCLVAQEAYEEYNLAYVFAPGGDTEPVIKQAQLAEKECVEKAGALP